MGRETNDAHLDPVGSTEKYISSTTIRDEGGTQFVRNIKNKSSAIFFFNLEALPFIGFKSGIGYTSYIGPALINASIPASTSAVTFDFIGINTR